ncbi:MAG TPA: aminoacyl-tRNA hydrolase [bacterium]|nr:aminoacyl-tRNA hydrolase [bacterium]
MIAGLGNPGREYSRHRHNIGFMVLRELASRHGIEAKRRSFGAHVGSGVIRGEAVILAMPLTFMNCSGDSVAPLIGYYKLSPGDLVVIHDDLDLELGRIKLARGAGHGGHNGIRSIIDALGTNDFLRVRAGIGRPPERMDPASYVLHAFDAGEEDAAGKLVSEAADAVEILLEEGLEAAMRRCH